MRRIMLSVTVGLVMAAMLLAMAIPAFAKPPSGPPPFGPPGTAGHPTCTQAATVSPAFVPDGDGCGVLAPPAAPPGAVR